MITYRCITCFLVALLLTPLLTPKIYAQQAQCAEVYTQGVGWTNTFGMGRCSGSGGDDDDEDSWRHPEDWEVAAAALLVGWGAYYIFSGPKEGSQLSNFWNISDSRDSVIGRYLDKRQRFELRLISPNAFKRWDQSKVKRWDQSYDFVWTDMTKKGFTLLDLRWNLWR